MNIVIESDGHCLICLNHEYGRYRDRVCKQRRIAVVKEGFQYEFDCSICGKYETTGIAYLQLPRDTLLINRKMRAAVSHKFKLQTIKGIQNKIEGNKKVYDHFKYTKLPSIKSQLLSIIQYIGKESDKIGGNLSNFPVDFHSIIGSLDRDSALQLVKQLKHEGLVVYETGVTEAGVKIARIYLTLKGWKYYENVEESSVMPEIKTKIAAAF